MRTDNFKSQSYFRLIKYVKPYKTRLIIGILSGMLTGGFFGASFFWLKGFVQPFETTTAPAFAHSQKSDAPAKKASEASSTAAANTLGDSYMKQAGRTRNSLTM